MKASGTSEISPLGLCLWQNSIVFINFILLCIQSSGNYKQRSAHLSSIHTQLFLCLQNIFFQKHKTRSWMHVAESIPLNGSSRSYRKHCLDIPVIASHEEAHELLTYCSEIPCINILCRGHLGLQEPGWPKTRCFPGTLQLLAFKVVATYLITMGAVFPTSIFFQQSSTWPWKGSIFAYSIHTNIRRMGNLK